MQIVLCRYFARKLFMIFFINWEKGRQGSCLLIICYFPIPFTLLVIFIQADVVGVTLIPPNFIFLNLLSLSCGGVVVSAICDPLL